MQKMKSLSDGLRLMKPKTRERFLEGLSDETIMAMPWIFEFWALPHQLPPEGDWRIWCVMGGRGAGKTRAGAEWVRGLVEGARPTDAGAYRRVALISETIDQAREVMVFGESGILACSPPDRRPKWIASRKMLEWPNGAIAQIFSGNEPEALRGPQFDAAWVDEFAKWKKAEESWDMLQFGLRLGDAPKVMITTTPRNVPILKSILAKPETVTTHATSHANRAHLAPDFIAALEARYHGSFLGRQELMGEFVQETEGALWTQSVLDKQRGQPRASLDRVIVAIDPPASHHKNSDECGIIVAGIENSQSGFDGARVYILSDLSLSMAKPEDWAARAIAAYYEYEADAIMAEVNQGGNMVEAILRQVDPTVHYKPLRALQGKTARAEPVSALYAQGKVFHAGVFDELESQLLLMAVNGYQGGKSPDRVDALVWAVTELLVTPFARLPLNPRVRQL